MRLIDADALMKVIREHDYPLRSHFNSTDNGMFTIGVQQAVDDAPTIDAVPVVRCCECKYYENTRLKVFENCCRKDLLIPMKPNDYCSYGEKMEDKPCG